LPLYERRPDKQYSLIDCISMNVMRRKGISEILTRDRHFSQEGFVRLLTVKC
jgi:predicted nucleic acid-binding protein